MRKSRYLTITMMIAFLLALPLVWINNTGLAKAATTPTFEKTKVELVGAGTTYTMVIKDKIDKSTYTWSSSNTAVAKVSTKGVITAVAKGTAKITCKVTYPSGKTTKTKTLTCNVTVTVPATGVKISNASLTKGAHVLTVGDSFTFKCTLEPAKTSDKAFWSIFGGDAASLRIDDAASGKVTALKAGKVMLAVTAAKTSTKKDADASNIKDIIIVEVIDKVIPPEPEVLPPKVTAVKVEDSNKIVVDFDSPVLSNTLISSTGELLNIEIFMGKDSKKPVADDPGKLKGSLSTDGKQLTITTEKALNGSYSVCFSEQVIGTNGKPLEYYYRKISYADLIPPAVLNTTVDDTGLIATIYFTEPINFINMTINEVGLVTTSLQDTNPNTISILKNAMNYVISEDKKSLKIDLTNIAVSDRNKTFKVVISGITDMAGNAPLKSYVEAYVKTDTSYKPQAVVDSVIRTGYNTITVNFSRAIDPNFPGFIQIEGSGSIMGQVDPKDNRKVNYTISDYDATYTGYRKLTVSFWNSYNVNPADTTRNTYEKTMFFELDTTAPSLVSYDYNTDNQTLILRYSKDVTLTSASGTLYSTYTSLNDDIKIINNSYTEVVHNEGKNIIKLRVTNMIMSGRYDVTIPQGFVSDSFRNLSLADRRSIVVTGPSGGTSGSELSPPYYVFQNEDNNSKITLKFRNKLDRASAEAVANYRIPGVIIINAELKENADDTGATVVLTLAENTIEYNNLSHKLTISGVKGYNNSYTAINNYDCPISLKENKRPNYIPSPIYDKNNNTIKIGFSETIIGTVSEVKLSQNVNGSIYNPYVGSVSVNGSYITLNLASAPLNNTWLEIEFVSYDIKDINGNVAIPIPKPIVLSISY